MEVATTARQSERSINFELLRLAAMFMIVACHAVLHLDWYGKPSIPVGTAMQVSIARSE